MRENAFISPKVGKLLMAFCRQSRKKRATQFLIFTAGLLFIILGIALKEIFPSVVKMIIARMLVIAPSNSALSDFITVPIPIYMQFYMFNVTNTKEILAGGKPALQQIGPFTYLETRRKHDLNWTDDTVEYFENRKYFFVPEMSNGLTEDVMITTLNPVLISLASMLADLQTSFSPLLRALFELTRQRFGLNVFITRKAGDLLFDGYKENFLLEVYKFTENPLHELGEFAFFYQQNGSDAEKYSVFTGSSGLDSLQVISKLDGSKTLHFWSDPYCDMINGTDGNQSPLPVSPLTDIYVYISEICRSIFLSFEKEIYYEGLKLFRYTLPYEVFPSITENEYCCVDKDESICRSPLFQISPCQGGAPLIASTPHFYMGDEDLIFAVDGLNPIKEEHEIYIDVEPNTGATFRAMKRAQLNIPLKPYADLPDLSNVTSVIFPLLWFNESAEVPAARARQVFEQLTTPVKIVKWITYGLYAMGFICMVVAIASITHGGRKQFKKKLQNKDNEVQPFETVFRMSANDDTNTQPSFDSKSHAVC